MQKIKIRNIFFTIAILGIVLSCYTYPEAVIPPPEIVYVEREVVREVEVFTPIASLTPLTTEILSRMQRAANFNFRHIQFFLSGGIILERVVEDPRQAIIDGTVVFEENQTRRLIVIEDRTAGEALNISVNDGRVTLSICFDEDDEYQIQFSIVGEGPNTRFYLQFTPEDDPVSDVKGSINYGGQPYRLRFTGNTPYLMLNLFQTSAPQTRSHRPAGRRVQTVQTPAAVPQPESRNPLTVDNLNRLRRAEDFSIDRCQFFLAGTIILERNVFREEQRIENGSVYFGNNNLREEITINDQTPGLALEIEESEDTINLYIYFDSDNRNRLMFTALKDEPNARFNLRYNAQHDLFSDLKGTIDYNEQTYRLRFTGATPHILLRLDIRGEPTIEERRAPGRIIID